MSNQQKIIADDKIPFLRGVLESFADVEYYPGKDINNEIVMDADALITRTRTKCDEELLTNSKIKLITTATIGFDHIDQDYCKDNDIKWINAPGCNSTSVMQYVSTILLKIAQKEKFLLKDKTIGIVGVGNVGSKIQKISEIFGMKVLLNDPPREEYEGSGEFIDIHKIMSESDIITFHVPLQREGKYKTFHIADSLFFDNLGKKAMIINTSRGEVIDNLALKTALLSEKIGTSVLDVWENEPDIDLELMEILEFATPHIAGYSAEGKANGTAVCVNAISDFFDLGIKKNWYPQNIPQAENGNKLFIDCAGKSEQQIISEAISSTYLVERDDMTLRKSPKDFEKHRGNYPIRREFSNYFVDLNECSSRICRKVRDLGFNLL